MKYDLPFACDAGHGADVRHPLLVAVSLGNVKAVQEFLDSPDHKTFADVTDSESGWNCLHRACYYGHMSIVRSILKQWPWLASERDREGNLPVDLISLEIGKHSFS
jgi:ankyrin repeat protein